ncbi:MAG: tail fiber domain-containing protein [Bacteroidota bacterium]
MNRILALIILLSPFADHLIAQWSGGSSTNQYVRLNNGNDEYGVWIADFLPVGTTNPNAKLHVDVNPVFHGGIVSQFTGNGMSTGQDVLRLRINKVTNSNPFYIRGVGASGSSFFSVDSRGKATLKSSIDLLDLNASSSDRIAMRVRDDEALWYDGTAFSWGFGGTWNRFARPMTIGSGTQPDSNTALRVDGGKRILNAGGDITTTGGGDITTTGGGNVILQDNGSLIMQGPGTSRISFRATNGLEKSALLSGGNFLRLQDLTQVILSAGGLDRVRVTAQEGTLFSTNVSMRTGRQIQFANNAASPLSTIRYQEGVNNSPASLRIANTIENDQIEIITDKGNIDLNNGIGGGVFLRGAFVGIREKNPMHALHVLGDVGITGEFFAMSDARVKRDIVSLTDAGEIIEALRPVHYSYNTDDFPTLSLPDHQQYGLIAQEVEDVIPELVTHHSQHDRFDGGLKGVNYMGLIPILVKGYQEQQDEIKDYKKEISNLEERLARLEEIVQNLE